MRILVILHHKGPMFQFEIARLIHIWAIGGSPRTSCGVDSMVKMPRKIMRYSPFAGKHTEHTVERVKKRRASELKWGQRRFRRVTAGYRGFPRPKPSGEKPTKRVNLIYRCTETGKAHSPKGKRARKFELVDN